MANPEHLEIVKLGVKEWNAWRIANLNIRVDLKRADLAEIDLSGARLARVDLSWACLSRSNLNQANLHKANLTNASLWGTRLNEAKLTHANLTGAYLPSADLYGANLSEARLTGAILEDAKLSYARLHKANMTTADLDGAEVTDVDLREGILFGVNLAGADLRETNLHDVILSETLFINVDLSSAKDLHSCEHMGSSALDSRTLARSGRLPLSFLRGCGLSDPLIEYLPSLFAGKVIQFYSCFISYSSQDEEFAKRLHADLQDAGVRCWFAPEEMKGGEKLYDQIDTAIRIHDKLLLVLSGNSMNSEWVRTEIRRCRKAEKKEGKRKLFPLRLVEMPTINDWECFDADYGKDLAVEVREYFIPDFSNWKDHDSYKKAFERLLRDLKESGKVVTVKR